MSIHESSIIHPSAEIDENVEIGPFCIVGEKVKVKSGSKISNSFATIVATPLK